MGEKIKNGWAAFWQGFHSFSFADPTVTLIDKNDFLSEGQIEKESWAHVGRCLRYGIQQIEKEAGQKKSSQEPKAAN